MSSRSRSDRLRTTAAIVLCSIALGGVVFVVSLELSEELLEHVAVSVAVVGAAAVAPLYLLYASWYDETRAVRNASDDSVVDRE